MSPKPSTAPPAPDPAPWGGTLEEWQRRAGPHQVTLKSGQQITFRLMSVGELMLRDAVPDDLREIVALHLLNKANGGLDAVIASETLNPDDDPAVAERLQRHLRQSWQLTLELVAAGLVDPVVTREQLATPGFVPFDDLEEATMLITGRQAFDSRGVRIGVEELSVLATFRHQHGCPESCPGCEATLRDLSSVHMGQL